MRRAKIVCTLGPATHTYSEIRSLVQAGMDVARFNLSHGTHDQHLERYHHVRAAGDELERAVGVLADLQGPKIRLGAFPRAVALERDATFTITIDDVEGDAERAGTTHKGLPHDVNPGDPILVDDGKVQLEVISANDSEVVTKVIVPGRVSSHKGLNLPGVPVSVPALSEKDVDDLRWALRTGVDMVALSFVRRAEDRKDVDRVMDEEGIHVPVIAKVEKPQAVEDLDGIVDAFDSIMIARGDLGVELPLEEVPIVQKRAATVARKRARPVIVATQVLESMVTAPRPTRAEASDAANAVLDGADAIMLSGETSVGSYPIEAVETMARIIEMTEKLDLDGIQTLEIRPKSPSGAVTLAATDIANLVDAKYLVTFTLTGGSAQRLARMRPKTPLMAFTPRPEVRSRMALVWGVETFIAPEVKNTDEMVQQVDTLLQEIGRVQPGDIVVICAGSPPGTPGKTNAIRVHRVGDVPGHRH